MYICHTPPFNVLGKPFQNPDGSPAVYNPPDTQQSIRNQAQLPGSSSQHQQQQVAQTRTRRHTYLSLFVPLSVCPHMCVCVSLRWFSTRLYLTLLHRCCLSLLHSHTTQYVSLCSWIIFCTTICLQCWLASVCIDPFPFKPTGWRALHPVRSCELSVDRWSHTHLPCQSGFLLCRSSSSPCQPPQLLPALTSGTSCLWRISLFWLFTHVEVYTFNKVNNSKDSN